jgi:hypothetical protein
MTTSRLTRSIVVVLSLKVSVVLLVALFVFGPGQRPKIDEDALNRQILDNSGKSQTGAFFR